jgi:hypothetical protein
MEVFYNRQKEKKTREKWCDQSGLETGPQALSLVKWGGEGRGKGRKQNK